MTDDIGMIKGPGPTGRNSPSAKMGSADQAQKAREAGAVSRAQENARAEEVAQEVAQGLNDLVHELHRELRFSVDQDSGETVIKVVDRETEEVVRQIPSEEVVALRKRLEEAAGVIFQDSA